MKIDPYTLKDLRPEFPDTTVLLEAYPGPEGECEPCLGFLVQDFGEACLVVSRLTLAFEDSLGLSGKERARWPEFEAALRTARHHEASLPSAGERIILYFPDIQIDWRED